ncbi:MAG TPA: TraR/DksA C4-type zinc finger protein [Pyrinomonadaceae bacterium]|nr:TraR/DksA C4-type zinc finger protein [Pyrinomonadaceae bacterium]
MNENHTINLVEIPIGGKGGFVWNRLHGERENICEALLKDSGTTIREQQKGLQARLRKVDDALDRLMSGSYGRCCECGHAIDETRLDIDPALSLCLDCRHRQATPEVSAKRDSEVSETDELLIEDLNPFDTIFLRTHNSDYRILLLDPKTGRALVEGGHYLLEPNEALLQGSAVAGDALKPGTICAGCRLEMWVGERVFLTSPVKTVRVKHNDAAESLQDISTALH